MRCISLNITFQPYCRVSGEANIHCCVTCEGHFPQQVLDLWRNAQFVKVQAEMKPGFRPQDSHSNILTRARTHAHARTQQSTQKFGTVTLYSLNSWNKHSFGHFSLMLDGLKKQPVTLKPQGGGVCSHYKLTHLTATSPPSPPMSLEINRQVAGNFIKLSSSLGYLISGNEL